MPTYRLTFRPVGAWPRRPLLLDIDADLVDVEPSGQLTLWQVQLVMGQPRWIVVRRLGGGEADVKRLCRRTDGAQPGNRWVP